MTVGRVCVPLSPLQCKHSYELIKMENCDQYLHNMNYSGNMDFSFTKQIERHAQA